MRYKKYKDGIKVFDVNDFDIEQTLKCGQCFRFFGEKNNYFIIAHGKKLNIKQDDNKIFFWPCSVDEFENIWINYFDLERNYSHIKKVLAQKNKILAEAINFCGGIRILNQEKFETLISFIISQNNHIPRIKKIIEKMSCEFGNEIEKNYFAFPNFSQLKNANEEKLMNCKMGFRLNYILDAKKKKKNGLDLGVLKNRETEIIKKNLMSIKGVGDKVSDCVLLFAYGRREIFPIDTWIKKISQKIFFGNQEADIKKIHEFAKNNFGDLAGYAQQYLFYYFRGKKF